jgi:xanthine dehydrogenase YagT iron-sulfur-binding subunit
MADRERRALDRHETFGSGRVNLTECGNAFAQDVRGGEVAHRKLPLVGVGTALARQRLHEPQAIASSTAKSAATMGESLHAIETIDGLKPETPPHGDHESAVAIRLTVNGKLHTLTVDPWVTLLDLLRERLALTGTKKGCNQGQCGACTVLVDGRRVNSCLLLAVTKDGAAITTIEGLGTADALHPLQRAFVAHDALQCGYCTPGQICSAAGLIAEGHARNRDDIRELMSGNICRCGAYTHIVDAIEEVLAPSTPDK